MKMRDLVVGVVFFSAVGVLLYFAVELGGAGQVKLPWERTETEYTIRFPSVTGLSKGSPVWVSGVPKGEVQEFYVDGETGHVDVLVTLDSGIRLRRDCRAEIVSSSAFGGKAVALELGADTESYRQEDGPIRGEMVEDLFTAAGRAVGKINEGIDIAVDTIKEVNAVVKDVRAGRGPVGTVLYDEKVAADIAATVENVREMSDDGKGIASDVRSITKKIDSGEGAAALLLNDPEVAENVRKTIENVEDASEDAAGAGRSVRSIVEKIDGGKGLLGVLVNDEETGEHAKSIVKKTDTTMDSVQKTFEETGELVAKVNRGEGSVGKLFNDDTLYNDILNSINTLRAGFEDIREQAPITTFASLLFQVFQ